ncbi:hypothetical protein QFC22_001727 [Naganishia vaughanmartiniae]|uniref:Uncharacterized protein n=1 Tax=Naganishia vaughanmartiniae TaxID=1424756 RepID=A0ACC2XGZ4_9TREE|nr:hypothetical protein QFC22_001727 [Naganishia vaughanmartiniae]
MADIIIDSLFHGDSKTRNEAIDKYFAEDAIYRHPLFNVKGKAEIKQAYDMWARMGGGKPVILNKLCSGPTCMIQMEYTINPLPFVSLTLPSVTVLNVEPSTDAGTQIITFQEDTWSVRHIIENLPIYGWWHKNVVIKALSNAVLFTDRMMVKTDVVSEKYIAPKIAQGEQVAEETLHEAVATSGKVAGAGYQLVTDAATKLFDYSTEAAGQVYATVKSVQVKTEGKVEDVALEGARQAGVIVGATKSTLDRILFFVAQVMSFVMQMFAALNGKAHKAIDEGKARAKSQYDQGMAKVSAVTAEARDAAESADASIHDAKAEAANKYSVGVQQGNQRGFLGLASWWGDKVQAQVPYAATARAYAVDGKDRLQAQGDSAYSDIKHTANKTVASAEARLSALGETVDTETSRFQEGFEQGRGIGKDLENDVPGQARGAMDQSKEVAGDLANDAIDMAQEGLEKGKEVATDAQGGLEEMRP